eukprot:jgi/Bigna1/146099/aug1.109_g20807
MIKSLTYLKLVPSEGIQVKFECGTHTVSDYDFVAIASVGSGDADYITYAYNAEKVTNGIIAIEHTKPGNYVLKYFDGDSKLLHTSAEFEIKPQKVGDGYIRVVDMDENGVQVAYKVNGFTRADQDWVCLSKPGSGPEDYEKYTYTNCTSSEGKQRIELYSGDSQIQLVARFVKESGEVICESTAFQFPSNELRSKILADEKENEKNREAQMRALEQEEQRRRIAEQKEEERRKPRSSNTSTATFAHRTSDSKASKSPSHPTINTPNSNKNTDVQIQVKTETPKLTEIPLTTTKDGEEKGSREERLSFWARQLLPSRCRSYLPIKKVANSVMLPGAWRCKNERCFPDQRSWQGPKSVKVCNHINSSDSTVCSKCGAKRFYDEAMVAKRMVHMWKYICLGDQEDHDEIFAGMEFKTTKSIGEKSVFGEEYEWRPRIALNCGNSDIAYAPHFIVKILAFPFVLLSVLLSIPVSLVYQCFGDIDEFKRDQQVCLGNWLINCENDEDKQAIMRENLEDDLVGSVRDFRTKRNKDWERYYSYYYLKPAPKRSSGGGGGRGGGSSNNRERERLLKDLKYKKERAAATTGGTRKLFLNDVAEIERKLARL